MGTCFHHMSKEDRLRLETLFRAGHTPKEISKLLGFHLATIYREKKRGAWQRLNSNLTYSNAYSPERAQQDYDYKATAKGAPLKLGSNYALERYIEGLVTQKGYSPAAVAYNLKSNPQNGTLCEATIYRYAKNGVFSHITNKDFPEKGIRKHPYQKVTTKKKNKTHLGTSIEQRPKEVAERNTFGNWEMDCVKGKLGTNGVFLVLTERLHCTELVIKLPRHTSSCVVQALDALEKNCGKTAFKKLFKTITMDNGSEFANSSRLESGTTNRRRTNCYYCHPQCPSERPNNERQNRFIRRRYPKGMVLTNVPQSECTALSSWINNYPVESLGGKAPAECFLESCQKEGIRISAALMAFLSPSPPHRVSAK